MAAGKKLNYETFTNWDHGKDLCLAFDLFYCTSLVNFSKEIRDAIVQRRSYATLQSVYCFSCMRVFVFNQALRLLLHDLWKIHVSPCERLRSQSQICPGYYMGYDHLSAWTLYTQRYITNQGPRCFLSRVEIRWRINFINGTSVNLNNVFMASPIGAEGFRRRFRRVFNIVNVFYITFCGIFRSLGVQM